MKTVYALILSGFMLAGCSSEPSDKAAMDAEQKVEVQKTETVAPAPKPTKKETCAVDAECGEGGMCIKPEAADYGFCLN